MPPPAPTDPHADPNAAEPFTIAILAGGFGQRLGRDKASAEAAGRPLLHWTADAVQGITDDLLIVRRLDQRLPPPPPGLRWRDVSDRRAGAGPLAGIEAALLAARHPLVVAVATDMPLVRPGLVAAIGAACAGVDVCMPVVGGREQPLCAAYRRTALPVIQSQLEAGDGRIRMILRHLAGRRLAEADLAQYDPGLESFTNVNRPSDLARVGRILTQRRRTTETEETP